MIPASYLRKFLVAPTGRKDYLVSAIHEVNKKFPHLHAGWIPSACAWLAEHGHGRVGVKEAREELARHVLCNNMEYLPELLEKDLEVVINLAVQGSGTLVEERRGNVYACAKEISTVVSRKAARRLFMPSCRDFLVHGSTLTPLLCQDLDLEHETFEIKNLGLPEDTGPALAVIFPLVELNQIDLPRVEALVDLMVSNGASGDYLLDPRNERTLLEFFVHRINTHRGCSDIVRGVLERLLYYGTNWKKAAQGEGIGSQIVKNSSVVRAWETKVALGELVKDLSLRTGNREIKL